MKNKRGFTLIELLAVLTLLIIIATIAFPNIVNQIKQNKNNEYNTFSSLIEQATELYVERNIADYPSLSQVGGVAFVPISSLIDANYIKADAIDPASETGASSYNVIVTTNSDKTKSYKYNGSKSLLSNYVQSGLILHYDAIENVGPLEQSSTTTLWHDLTTNAHNATVSGTWSGDNLLIDGTTINTGIDAATILSTNEDYTLSLIFKILTIPTASSTYGYTGVVFGAANSSGAGTVWIRSENNPNIDINNFVGTTGMLKYSKVITYREVPTDIYDISLVYSHTDNKIQTYLNGQLIDTKAALTGNFNALNNIVINGSGVYTGSYETGSLPSMRVYSAKIYDRALTKTEIETNHEVDQNRFEL